MKRRGAAVSVFRVAEDQWAVFVDYEEPGVCEGAFVKKWKTEGDAETHAEIIRCAMAWEPSRAGRRWRTRTKAGRRAGDKGA